MALAFAHGTLLWASADGVGVTYTVSGLPFQPKALMFWTNGLTSSVDAAAGADDRRSLGFAAGTTDRRCIGLNCDNLAAAADTNVICRADAVLAYPTIAAAVDGLLDLDALLSDGFRLIVDDALTDDIRVFWMAWGGSDITDVATGLINEPAATGNVSYTAGAGFQPSVLLFGGSQLTTDPPAVGAVDSGMMFGAATGTGAGNQWVYVTNSDQGSTAMDTDMYMRGDECLAMITAAGGNPNARATFNGFTSTGFDLNWLARATTGRNYMFLAIAGGNWSVGSYTLDKATVGNTATVSGLPFTPIGGLVAGHAQAENTVATSVPQGRSSIGCWSSLTSRRAMAMFDQSAQADANINLAIEYDAIYVEVSQIATVTLTVDLDAILRDGFRAIVDETDAGPGVRFHGYLTFGNRGLPPFPRPSMAHMLVR